ncbi:hypothetical protein [Ruegeria sp. HKCCC1038]|uniref:hypothetical protein n=1 Tax=Ruegeria sp. HKCCC1038 TaxID=2682982 RepID=UPI00148988EF|nr:hypothetical protein [Ruegeria sp. HKCCC1038]
MGVHVPGLRQKLKLLVTYGPYRSIDEIAYKLGRRPKTILSWADGSPGAEPDNVPNRSFNALVEVFSEAVGKSADNEKVRELLFSRASWLEQELRKSSRISLRDLLESQAEQSAFGLSLPSDTASPVSIRKLPDPGADYHISLGELFRLNLRRDLRDFNLLALQYSNAVWVPVSCSIDLRTGFVFLPAQGSFMEELSARGVSFFALVANKQPYPNVVQNHVTEGVAFEIGAITALADLLKSTSPKDRRVFSSTIQFS